MAGNFLCKKLGKTVVALRKLRKLTQEELAFLARIDRTYLARIEEGKANPTIKVVFKIAIHLGIPLNVMLEEL